MIGYAPVYIFYPVRGKGAKMSTLNLKMPTLEQLLKAGVHFGHQTKRKDPKMDRFVHSVFNHNQIIDLTTTIAHLERSAEFLYQTAKTGAQSILVGTKRQASPIVKKYAEQAGCLYVNLRWLGGTFTNYDSVAFKLRELERIETGLAKGAFNHYTKKERLLLARQVEKLQDTVGGLRGLKKFPSAVVAIDVKREKTAVAEANAVKVPVVAMVDTNSNPSIVQFAIPSNDDAIKSIETIVAVLADAIKQGYAEYQANKPKEKEIVGSKDVRAETNVVPQVNNFKKEQVQTVTPASHVKKTTPKTKKADMPAEIKPAKVTGNAKAQKTKAKLIGTKKTTKKVSSKKPAVAKKK